MEDKNSKRYLELQLEELKTEYSDEAAQTPPPADKGKDEKNAKIAEIYEDCWEYEEDLAGFEAELEIVKANALADIATELRAAFPEEERDFAQELETIAEAGWTQLVEVDQTHPKEQLELVKSTAFPELVQKLKEQFTESGDDFEAMIREMLIARWERLINIKKDHIKEEIAEIKTMGLKPNYVKRIYKQYHNIK